MLCTNLGEIAMNRQDKHYDAERKLNIHAPWRIEYINMLSNEEQGCFLCRIRDEKDRDAENLLLWRAKYSMVVMNRFPYSAGHLLIAPYEHIGQLEQLSSETMLEMMRLACDAQKLLTTSIKAEGFNIGMNIGHCAGAGLEGHIHLHIVPRWGGDTNFMAVLADVRIISQSLTDLYRQLQQTSLELNLPRVNCER